jgi:hypothetical protein
MRVSGGSQEHELLPRFYAPEEARSNLNPPRRHEQDLEKFLVVLICPKSSVSNSFTGWSPVLKRLPILRK